MGLKSYSNLKKKGKKKKKGVFSSGKDLVTGGVTALVGIALVSETANAVSSI